MCLYTKANNLIYVVLKSKEDDLEEFGPKWEVKLRWTACNSLATNPEQCFIL